jgi:hypothetical protein
MARRDQGVAGLNLVDFRYVKSYPDPGDKNWIHLSQAEVLIPDRIPLSMVNRITCVSEASKREAVRQWGSISGPEFHVDLSPFKSMPDGKYVNFSYVKDAWLEVGDQKGQKATVNRRNRSKILVAVSMEALGGATCTVRLTPNGITQITKLPNVGSWIWKPEFEITNLLEGSYTLEISLDEIRWATLTFEVTP